MTNPSQPTDNDAAAIERFLLGQMSPDEEMEFRQLLKGDTPLREETSLMWRIIRQISSSAKKHAQMAKWDNAISSVKRPFGRITVLQASTIAAAVAIAVVVVAFLYNSGSAPSSPMALQDGMRGGNTSVASIEATVDNADLLYRTAISDLETALSDTVISPDTRPEEAEYQRMLIAQNRYELQWLLIRSLIASSQVDSAATLLKDYAKLPGDHREEALSLSRQLKLEI